MPNTHISSLHSPHVERVKALLGSRGKKFRKDEKVFIADGLQSVREALSPKFDQAPRIEKLYVTDAGLMKLQAEVDAQLLQSIDIFPVTDEVMHTMADTESPQGILALCSFTEYTLYKLSQIQPTKIAYFWELQDPGNSGTVIRTADACGFDAVVFSPKSVDTYSPKTVRATVGSLWHLPVVEAVSLEEITAFALDESFAITAFAGESESSFLDLAPTEKQLLIFGNEARGLPELPDYVERVRIPMLGHTESLNVASAAAIAMFHSGISQRGHK